MRRLWSCLRFDQKINWPIFLPKQFQVEHSQSFWESWACGISMRQLEGECCNIRLFLILNLFFPKLFFPKLILSFPIALCIWHTTIYVPVQFYVNIMNGKYSS